MRARFPLMLAASLFAWVSADTLSAGQRARSANRDTPRAAVAQAATGQEGSPSPAYVGDEMCLSCHVGQDATLARTAHGQRANPRTPAAQRGCESCHGPGERHLADPSDDSAIRKPARMTPRDVSQTCLGCHATSTHALWQGSVHDARNLSCATCHSVHAPASPKALLKTVSEVETCATCHRTQVQRTKRVAHMPVSEGVMTCSSCHNPHGATNLRLLRVGNWINESCISCHAEKRGPFLFEHAAGRESCVSCHDPHGSSNDRMLVARAPMLCQRCHIGTNHPSVLYDNTAVTARRNRIVGRSCVNCHSQIHGSNHPSGQSLTR